MGGVGPKDRGKGCIHTGKDGKKVVFEGPDGPLSPIATMHIWGHQLKLGSPGDGDGVLVGRTSLVVQDLEIN